MQEQLDLIDIYGVWYKPWWQQAWFKSAVITLGVGTVCCVGYWVYVRFFRVTKIKSPYEVALERLTSFTVSDYESPKLFYSTLTDVLKTYFQERYKEPFIGTTDDEMIQLCESIPNLSKTIIDKLKEVLAGVVLIKFANQRAAQEQMKKALALSVSILKESLLVDNN